MNVTDPIADMLTRIRNANSAGKASVSMPSTKVLVEIARVISEEGYVEGYVVEDTKPQKTLTITLKYGQRRAKTIKGIRRISKPGLRIYSTVDPTVQAGIEKTMLLRRVLYASSTMKLVLSPRIYLRSDGEWWLLTLFFLLISFI